MRGSFGKSRVYNVLSVVAAGVAIIGMLFYTTEIISSVRDALSLCTNVIIPSLFPFIVLSSMAVEMGLAQYLGILFDPLMRPVFRLPGACAPVIVLGLIGGYPVGAQAAIAVYEKGLCTKNEAERLLSFCNNSGPAFILGTVGAGIFLDGRVGILLFAAHAAASLTIGIAFRGFGGKGAQNTPKNGILILPVQISKAFTTAVTNGARLIINICAFVIFFAAAIRCLYMCGAIPALGDTIEWLFSLAGIDFINAEQLITGFIEMSSGLWSLRGVAGTLAARLSMAAFMLGWAGISVHCQVLSFMGESGLSITPYIVGKLLHASLSAVYIIVLTRFIVLSEPAASFFESHLGYNLGALKWTFVAAGVCLLVWILPAGVIAAAQKIKRRMTEI